MATAVISAPSLSPDLVHDDAVEVRVPNTPSPTIGNGLPSPTHRCNMGNVERMCANPALLADGRRWSRTFLIRFALQL